MFLFWDCCHKIPETGWTCKLQKLTSAVLEAEVQCEGLVDLVPGESLHPCSWTADHSVLTGEEMRECFRVSLFKNALHYS